MTAEEYNQKARQELRYALRGAAGKKVAALRFRDLSRLSIRFKHKRAWRGSIPQLAEIWAKVVAEIAIEQKYKMRKGRPTGIVTHREKRLVDLALWEVHRAYASTHNFDSIVALMEPNPQKIGLTEFRQAVLDCAIALAKAESYTLNRFRAVSEIRWRLQGPQPQLNFLASRTAWRAEIRRRRGVVLEYI